MFIPFIKLETVESLESNAKFGFKAAGIVPFHRDRVINKVKSRPEDEDIVEEVRDALQSNAFVEILQDFRLGENVKKRSKGKRITIDARKSITLEDFGNTEENNEEFIDNPDP